MNPFHASYIVTQPYGCTGNAAEPPYGSCEHFHHGIDLVGPSANCPIYAAAPGTIFLAGTDTDGANYVIVQTALDTFMAYWHLSAISVSPGQQVDTNTQLGNQGMTGKATGPHLHFEVQQKNPYGSRLHDPDCPVDPNPYLADQGAANDMDTHQIAKDLYQIFTGSVPSADIINQKADFMNATGNAQQVILDIAQAGGWKSDWDCNHNALVSYRECFAISGEDPSQWATDRMQGGMTFDSQVHQELPPILANSTKADDLSKQLQQAVTDRDQAETEAAAAKSDAQQAKQALDALQNAPSDPQAVDCQQKADAAVQVALGQATANPWPLVGLWLRNAFKGGGK